MEKKVNESGKKMNQEVSAKTSPVTDPQPTTPLLKMNQVVSAKTSPVTDPQPTTPLLKIKGKRSRNSVK